MPHLTDCDRVDAPFAVPQAACRDTPNLPMTRPSRARARPDILRMLWLLAGCVLLAGCAMFGGAREGSAEDAGRSQHAATLPIDMLMGDWHVAARVPWFGERGRVASRIRFRADGESKVEVLRSWRDGFSEALESDASVARRGGPGGRVWKLRAWRVLPTTLRVLEAADDGSWLLLDAEDRDHAWILTRAQVVADEAYLELERRMRGHGVNTDRLRRVPQVPEQEGRLGFEPAAVPSSGR
jgi:apolipoprotein D and lipocalin family protein